jgi:hypothetical protein
MSELVDLTINDHSSEYVVLHLRREELILLYSHAVSVAYSAYGGVIFQMDRLLVDVDYLHRFEEVLEDLNILPDLEKNRDYYELLTKKDDCNKSDYLGKPISLIFEHATIIFNEDSDWIRGQRYDFSKFGKLVGGDSDEGEWQVAAFGMYAPIGGPEEVVDNTFERGEDY